MDGDNLFRIEATQAASEQFAKPMDLSEPPSWFLALLSAVVVVSVVGFLNVGKLSRKETVSGIIYQPEGTPKLISPKSGIVQSIAALDGSSVIKGEVLFIIGSEETAPSGQSYSREVESLRLQQAESRVSELNSNLSSLRSNELETNVKIKGLRSLLDQLNSDVKLQQQRVEMAEKSLHDVQPLFNSRQLSAFDDRKYETNALDAKQSLGNSRRLLSGAKIDLEKAFA